MNDVIEVDFPFVRCKASTYDGEGPYEFVSWKPGVVSRYVGNWGDTEFIAHGVGKMRLQVVSRHKPGKQYPERVFFVRTWVTPDGHQFGKTGLKITTEQAFQRRTRGYLYEFRLDNPEDGEIK